MSSIFDISAYHTYYVYMPNITLAIPTELLKAGRGYARQHDLSLNALVRTLVAEKVNAKPRKNAMRSLLELSKKIAHKSTGPRWSRDNIYRV